MVDGLLPMMAHCSKESKKITDLDEGIPAKVLQTLLPSAAHAEEKII
jgi:hypothetical protein